VNWYQIEIEIFLFGKDTEFIQAINKEDAIMVVKRKASKKFSCSEEHIEVMSCKLKT
tara:strand:- start:88 stop:258 length:171 start_codon:yes stop_codon:yes gene_type:complete